MGNKVSADIENKAISLLHTGLSQNNIAIQLGVSKDTIGRIKSRNNIKLGQEACPIGKRFSAQMGEKTGILDIEVTHQKHKRPRWLDIKNPTSLLKQCDIDENIWMVDTCRVSSSEVTMKLRQTINKITNDKPATYTNVHVSIKLKRRAPSEQAVIGLCNKLLRNKIKLSKIKYHVRKDPVLLEWCPYDHHHGLLAWAPEVEANWDLRISERFFEKAVTDVLCKSSPYNIGQIVIPIGQDWFHCDDPNFQTPVRDRILVTVPWDRAVQADSPGTLIMDTR